MTTPVLKTISSSVRPARVAVLLNSTDEDWRDNALKVIAYYSTIWGGSYNIIIPTDGHSIEGRFWDVLETYDADFLGYYYKGRADNKLNHPELYEREFERYKRHVLSQYPNTQEDTIRDDFDRQMIRESITRPISDELQAELKRRVAPFHFNEGCAN